MKVMTMKNILLTSVMVALAGTAAAATSGTTVTAAVNPYMIPPVTGYVSATVTSTASPRIALPSTAKTINAYVCTTRVSGGNEAPRNYAISGTDLLVTTATGAASGTLAVGDMVNCVIHYER